VLDAADGEGLGPAEEFRQSELSGDSGVTLDPDDAVGGLRRVEAGGRAHGQGIFEVVSQALGGGTDAEGFGFAKDDGDFAGAKGQALTTLDPHDE